MLSKLVFTNSSLDLPSAVKDFRVKETVTVCLEFVSTPARRRALRESLLVMLVDDDLPYKSLQENRAAMTAPEGHFFWPLPAEHLVEGWQLMPTPVGLPLSSKWF